MIYCTLALIYYFSKIYNYMFFFNGYSEIWDNFRFLRDFLVAAVVEGAAGEVNNVGERSGDDADASGTC